MKKQKINFFTTNPKEEKHTGIISPLPTKVTESNHPWSLISLNINGLNLPIKKHKLTEWIHKQDPAFCCIQETHLSEKDSHYLKVKGWEKIFQANGSKKLAGVAILISNKIDFHPKVIKKIRKYTSYSSKEKSTKMNSQF
jgi:exonuclease III